MPKSFDLPGNALKLTLSGKPFEVMLTGEKPNEYRRASNYIISRVVGKAHDYVVFYNGPYTGGALPWFACNYLGYEVATEKALYIFSNGLHVEVEPGMYILHLGPVIASGNLKPQHAAAASPAIERAAADS